MAEVFANIVTDHDNFEFGGPGTIQFTSDQGGRLTMLAKCPGCGEASALPLYPWEGRSRWQHWEFDGNRERPTLSPSVHHADGCGWHGYLRNGVWRD